MLGWAPTLIAAAFVPVSVIVVLFLALKVHIEDEDKPGKNLRCEVHRRVDQCIGASSAQATAGRASSPAAGR
jgi:hypothetical protein